MTDYGINQWRVGTTLCLPAGMSSSLTEQRFSNLEQQEALALLRDLADLLDQ